jgi:hypothetical protein
MFMCLCWSIASFIFLKFILVHPEILLASQLVRNASSAVLKQSFSNTLCSTTSMSNISLTIEHFETQREVFVIWYVMEKTTPLVFKNSFPFVHRPSFKLVTQNWQKRPKITLHNLVFVKISVVPSWCVSV